jgi:antagonist of KipI
MPALSILRPGMLTTVQDLGRWGFQSHGVPVSGAMDQYSHRLANRLVGNRETAATLEVTLIGPQVALDGDVSFAVTGAAFDLALNGVSVEMNRMVAAKPGSILKFGERRLGARSYIAIAGGVEVPEILGSRSTHVVTRMGGVEGRALRAGDRVEIGKKGSGAIFDTTAFEKCTRPLFPRGGARLRAIPAEPRLFEHLASQRFIISPHSDRMGYRLEGVAIGEGPTGEFISRAVATGSVQLPPTGQPILLMADHATTGGYAIAATVITADLPMAAQLSPGEWIEFEACLLETADDALREQEAALGRP